jgi:hypothetical protein
MLEVKVLCEAGYEQALYGLSLSYNAKSENMPARATQLAHKGEGHSKFLEAMMVWLDVRAPRYFWQEADTYRISTKQSESTMHTLLRRPLTKEDFQQDPDDEFGIDAGLLYALNQHIQTKAFRWVKRHLPESFMQRRVWCMSYKTLQNIWYQRHDHKLPEWHDFIDQVLSQIVHPEYIKRPEVT